MNPDKIVVVGAGPVGCLAAIYAANRGHDVEVYELRSGKSDRPGAFIHRPDFPIDLRASDVTQPLHLTRSINLALSERGINAMRHAGSPALLEAILSQSIPMTGRMIHAQRHGNPSHESQSYDIHGRAIRAVDRGDLNKKLLDDLESKPNVRLFFGHKLLNADFQKNLAWFQQRKVVQDNADEVEVSFDLLIGADGAHSAVRYHLMKYARMSFQQEYIDTLWCEFHIQPKPSSAGPDFKLSPSHLHIWPAGNFMFIALPSMDKSFTCTLFMPESIFLHLDVNNDQIIPFFKKHFPGVIPDLISADQVVHQYQYNPHLPLMSIKCQPFHYRSSAVILGDAAHAMVPFYGQGMNAGLESVRVLFQHLDQARLYHDDTTLTFEPTPTHLRASALAEYTAFRSPDAHAICDLAYANYAEMSSHVRSSRYLLRKFAEEHISSWFPWLGWATQYSRVSFSNERYSLLRAEAEGQKVILERIGICIIGGLVAAGIAFGLRQHKGIAYRLIRHIKAYSKH